MKTQLKFRKSKVVCAAVAVALSASLFAVATRSAGRPGRGPAPNEGPWNHDLVISDSTVGNRFKGNRIAIERAGVPSVTRDKTGRLVLVFQWFPYDDSDAFDKVGVSFSRDDGKTWSEPVSAKFKGLPKDYMRPFDPAIVLLEDGSFRMYFTSQQPPYRTPAIYSAKSKDAINYTFEPGVRTTGAKSGLVDSSAVYWHGKWHLYAHEFIPPEKGGNDRSRQENAYHGVSSDGVNFTAKETITVPAGASWIGNPMVDGGTLYFFGSGEGVFPATSTDGGNWKFNDGKSAVRAADPAVFKTKDGKWRIVSTGPMRADASPPPFSGPSGVGKQERGQR